MAAGMPLPAMPTLAPMTAPPLQMTLPGAAEVGGMLTTLVPAAIPVITSVGPSLVKSVAEVAPEVVKSTVRNITKMASGGASVPPVVKNTLPSDISEVGAEVVATDVEADSPVSRVKVAPPPEEGEDWLDTAKPFFIPISGLVIGAAMMQVESVAMWGKLVLYFGAQSFMNIFMSWALGTHVTVPRGTVLKNGHVLEKDLKGCPAGFLLTALQQIVSFVLFIIFYLAVYNTPHRYNPKPIKTSFEVISIAIFGCVFAANIALNNFSLGYISIGVNLIIRSCLPLTTYLSQQGLSVFGLYTYKPFKCLEVILMTIGVVCACVFTMADFQGKLTFGGRFIGVIGCMGSLLCGSLNLALAGVLGETKLNVLDTVAYMAVPATLALTPIIFFVSKPPPGQWKYIAPSMTDWEIVQQTWYYNKNTVFWIFVSGIFSFAYNLVQFNIVHTLSPSATAFGGNFNKAALTFMTLCLPFLQTKKNPPMPYIAWEWAALIVNIYAFSHYSYLQIQAKQQAAHKKMVESEQESSSEDEEEGSAE